MLLSTSMVLVTRECQIISSSTLYWELLVLWLTSSWNSCHQLRVCNLCFPLLQTLTKHVAVRHTRSSLLKTTKEKIGNWSQLQYCFPFIFCAVHSVPVYISVPPSPHFWCGTLRQDYCLLIGFVQRAQCWVLVCAKGSTGVVQVSNSCFSHTLIASFFSFYHLCFCLKTWYWNSGRSCFCNYS